MCGTVNGAVFLLGTPGYAAENSTPVTDSRLAALQAHGKTVVVLASAGRAVGMIAIADELRPTSARAVRSLTALGIEVIMLTGDNPATARAIAGAAGIAHYSAEALPEDKALELQQVQVSL